MTGLREDAKDGSFGNAGDIISSNCRHLKSTGEGQMGNKRGNPNWFQWYKGMPCLNPSGRPKGSGSMATYLADPKLFGLRRRKWWWFCLHYSTAITKVGNASEAARKAGYSPKSARFIASRLLKKPVIREMLRKNYEIQAGTRSLGNGLYMIPNEDGGYCFYQKPDSTQ